MLTKRNSITWALRFCLSLQMQHRLRIPRISVLDTQLQSTPSWLTILKKREAFRRAFDNFQPDVIVQYGPEKVETLMADAGIVRNRRKIEAAIRNAWVYLSIQKEVGSFDRYLWSFTGGKVILDTDDEARAHTELSDRISKDLKHRGMSFVGTTIIYAFLQAVGVVNDHELSCFCHPNNQ